MADEASRFELQGQLTLPLGLEVSPAMASATRTIKRLARQRFGVMALVTGSAAGQLITIAVAPILARLYSPEEFGTFAVILGSALILASISALRFELAIVLPDDEESAFGIVWLAFTCILAMSAIATLATLILGGGVADGLGYPEVKPYLYFITTLAALTASFSVLNQLAIRHQRYGAIASRNFLQQASGGAAQVGAGLLGWGVPGLLVGTIAGQTVGIASLLRASRIRSTAAIRGFRAVNLRRQFVRYRRFPIFLAPAALFNNLGQQAPILLIAGFYGAGSAGLIGLTQRVLAVPVTVVGLAIAQVYLGSLARYARGEIAASRALFWKTSRNLAILGTTGGFIVALVAPWSFAMAFGPDWTQSGYIAQAMVPLFITQMIASPTSPTLIVFEKTLTQLMWDIFRLIALIVPVFACWKTGQSVLTAVVSLSIAGSVMYILLWLLCLRTLYQVRRDPTSRT